MIRYLIGLRIGVIGARLLQHMGGWTKGSDYEDWNIIGKFGYRLMLKGIKMMGFTPDDVINHINAQMNAKEGF